MSRTSFFDPEDPAFKREAEPMTFIGRVPAGSSAHPSLPIPVSPGCPPLAKTPAAPAELDAELDAVQLIDRGLDAYRRDRYIPQAALADVLLDLRNLLTRGAPGA